MAYTDVFDLKKLNKARLWSGTVCLDPYVLGKFLQSDFHFYDF